jgi:hypothetical protein
MKRACLYQAPRFMKDHIIITIQQKKELRILLFCFIFAYLLNIMAVIIYKAPWIEIFTQIGYVFVVSIVLYFFVLLGRLIIFSVKKINHLRKK